MGIDRFIGGEQRTRPSRFKLRSSRAGGGWPGQLFGLGRSAGPRLVDLGHSCSATRLTGRALAVGSQPFELRPLRRPGRARLRGRSRAFGPPLRQRIRSARSRSAHIRRCAPAGPRRGSRGGASFPSGGQCFAASRNFAGGVRDRLLGLLLRGRRLCDPVAELPAMACSRSAISRRVGPVHLELGPLGSLGLLPLDRLGQARFVIALALAHSPCSRPRHLPLAVGGALGARVAASALLSANASAASAAADRARSKSCSRAADRAKPPRRWQPSRPRRWTRPVSRDRWRRCRAQCVAPLAVRAGGGTVSGADRFARLGSASAAAARACASQRAELLTRHRQIALAFSLAECAFEPWQVA